MIKNPYENIAMTPYSANLIILEMSLITNEIEQGTSIIKHKY